MKKNITKSQSYGLITYDDLYSFLKGSSFAFYASGEENPLIDVSDFYMSLGQNSLERQETFRQMVEEILEFDYMNGKPDQSLYYFTSPELLADRLAEVKKIKSQNLK